MQSRRCSKVEESACEHFQQHARNLASCFGWDNPELANQPLAIYGAELIQSYLSGLSPKTDGHSRRIVPSSCGHRSYQECLQRFVHFVRRNDQAGPGLLYFCRQRWIETDQPDLIAAGSTHHFHSSRSNAFGGSSFNRRSSAAGRAWAKASFHPLRAGRCGARTSPSAVTRNST